MIVIGTLKYWIANFLGDKGLKTRNGSGNNGICRGGVLLLIVFPRNREKKMNVIGHDYILIHSYIGITDVDSFNVLLNHQANLCKMYRWGVEGAAPYDVS